MVNNNSNNNINYEYCFNLNNTNTLNNKYYNKFENNFVNDKSEHNNLNYCDIFDVPYNEKHTNLINCQISFKSNDKD